MEQNETILSGYSDTEKGAYLGAIASLATADRQASGQTGWCDVRASAPGRGLKA